MFCPSKKEAIGPRGSSELKSGEMINYCRTDLNKTTRLALKGSDTLCTLFGIMCERATLHSNGCQAPGQTAFTCFLATSCSSVRKAIGLRQCHRESRPTELTQSGTVYHHQRVKGGLQHDFYFCSFVLYCIL